MFRSTYQPSTWHTTALLSQVISSEHKVILLGTAGVGKTAFFLRVRDGTFRQSATTCFPADYLIKTIRVPSSSSTEASLKIILYDTAGGEKFRSLTSNFFKNAHAAVLMFAVDDILSFDKMELEVENARHFVDSDFLWVVVGNKTDLRRDPHITEARVEAFCAQLGTSQWVYTSVKTGENVEMVLETVARRLFRTHHCSSLSRSVCPREEAVQLLSADEDELRKKSCKPQTWNCDT